jgi:uncharacterized damage-inducible protein DinB
MKNKFMKRSDINQMPEYFDRYINLVPDVELAQAFDESLVQIENFDIKHLTQIGDMAYAPGKWTAKGLIQHVLDFERIFSYRALRFARNEKQSMPGFDQDEYTRYSGADERDLDSIFEEYEAVRRATIALFDGLPEESLTRKGVGSTTFHSATVRALAYHIAGHELRHINIIKEKYL